MNVVNLIGKQYMAKEIKDEGNKLANQTQLTASDKQKAIQEMRSRFSELKIRIHDHELLDEFVRLDRLDTLTKQQEARRDELLTSITSIYGFHTGYWLYSMTNTQDKAKSIIEIRNGLIKEYPKPTDSELILIDQIAAAYWRARYYESSLNRIIEKEPGKWSYNQLTVNIMKEIHRGIDQANRQIIANLSLLRQSRHPNLNIKVNTDHAYISQNQQINQTPPENKTDAVNVVNDVNVSKEAERR